MQRFMTHRRCAFTIALTTVAFFPSIFIPGGSRVLGQDAVGVLHQSEELSEKVEEQL